MLFWILVAVLTAGVAALLLYPFLRPRVQVRLDDRAGEAAVYRDQLAELSRDLAGGLITAGEAAYARAEIGRRLLSVSDAPAPSAPSRRGHWLSQAFIIALLPAVGLCLYLSVGNPGLPSQPLAARLENPGDDMAILVAKAERHLAANPNDGRGWDVLAPIYFKLMRIGDAQMAYSNAIRLLGPSPQRQNGLAQAMIAAADGVITADARQALQQSLSLQPDNPETKYYLALALEQDGRKDEARDAFAALAKASPADAPWLGVVNEHIAKNGGTPDMAAANPDAPGNPDADQVAAADKMSSGDRQQMIRGMIDSLDAKLRDDPNNFEGWLRLIRSYAVLNDKDRAADALKRGLSAFPAKGEQGQQLLALAKELGVTTQEMQQ